MTRLSVKVDSAPAPAWPLPYAFAVTADGSVAQRVGCLDRIWRLVVDGDITLLRDISESSIPGTGEVALIFDTTSLGQLASQSRAVPGKTLRSVGLASPIANPFL